MSVVVDAVARPLVVAPARRRPRHSTLLMAGAAFAVMAGVLLMHSVPMVHSPGGHMTSTGSITEHSASAASGLSQIVENCAANCSGHSGMAMCMAVITIASALIFVRRLLKHHTAGPSRRCGVGLLGRHASRAPPWATPTLEKLSILRI